MNNTHQNLGNKLAINVTKRVRKKKRKFVRFYVRSVRCSSGKSEAKIRPQTLKYHPDRIVSVQTDTRPPHWVKTLLTRTQITDTPSLKLQTCLVGGGRRLHGNRSRCKEQRDPSRNGSKEPEDCSVNQPMHEEEVTCKTSLTSSSVTRGVTIATRTDH